MIVLGVVLLIIGVVVFVAGLSSYRNRDSQAVPLILGGLFRSYSESLGLAMIFIGGGLGLGGIGVMVSQLL